MKARLITVVVATQFFFLSSPSWADDDSAIGRPHISDIGGEDHSPGVTLVIVLSLLLVGFGIGVIVGKRMRSK